MKPTKVCTFPGCGKPHEAKGLCSGHRWQAMSGKALAPLRVRDLSLTVEQRFWAKVDKTPTCWNWTAHRNVEGYGRFRMGQKQLNAHRVSYEMTHGSIPAGILIDHMCHNPACVNPAHLRLATQKENQENHSGPRKDSTSGIRGVNWHKGSGKWAARVRHNGRLYAAGQFASMQEAEQAVIAKRLELHTYNDKDRTP